MNESFVTVCGNVVAKPEVRTAKTGTQFATFRVASTSRRKSQDGSAFVDGPTNFVNVVAFRGLGANVTASLERGHPVIVYGRLRVKQWTKDDRSGTSVEIDAYNVGHDLNRGTTAYSRQMRSLGDTNDRLSDEAVQEATQELEAAFIVEDGMAVDPRTGEVADQQTRPGYFEEAS
ncbi:MAG TPA: single-stranded DNA-binding protein [Candidatus Lustribacter sp.]|jgi:single-strand DNA-binding protein|nr:single-stranded DNA-binding protein [Candidatus Lustribacter sp.]